MDPSHTQGPSRFRPPLARLPTRVPRLPRRIDLSSTQTVTISASAGASRECRNATPATQNGHESYTGTVTASASAGASLRVPKCHACHAEWTRAVYRPLPVRPPPAPPSSVEMPRLPSRVAWGRMQGPLQFRLLPVGGRSATPATQNGLEPYADR